MEENKQTKIKGIILYQSKYGATKKYADRLSLEIGFDCVITKSADIKKVRLYDCIILAGGIYASGIAGISFLKKNASALSGKRIAVFCVGASPYDEKLIDEIKNKNLKGDLREIPCYYGRGAWNEEEMSFKDRMMCKMLKKFVAKQDPNTYEPWQKALICASGKKCDWTDKKYLNPLIEWIG